MAANASSGSKPSLLSTLPNDLPLEFLQKITQGFSKDLMLGQGAFGTVYKVQKTWTLEYIASMYSEIDPVSLQEVRTCIEIGLKCVDVNQDKRPSIAEIVDELNGMKAH
nr:unnamed protein product [Digitaria exilis]